MGAVIDFGGKPYPQQIEFFNADTRYIAYGGARGGGKSWAARTKSVLLALYYPGIQILLLRRTYPELRENHILALRGILRDVAHYVDSEKSFTFPNGSRLKLGYCAGESDVLQYQGQAYDVIFLEEATQFTEFQFQSLTECSRSSGICKKPFKPRMYLTCNPGGVGHAWVKRLFIDRSYTGSERAEDYTMIRSNVYDNKFLMEHSPDYVRTLENLPENRRRAMLLGDWNIFEGQYFPEFSPDLHVVEPFEIPGHWRRYVCMDYGLDMFACYWIAMDEHDHAYIYREIYESNLIVTDAANRINAMTTENVDVHIAPPDLWNRHSDTGKSTAEIFSECGVYLTKSQNDRVQGWYNLKEWLKPFTNEFGARDARLKVFSNCKNLIRCLPMIQYSDKNPNDCATDPHEITHAPDAIRYFASFRPVATDPPAPPRDWDEPEYELEDFINYGK